MQEEPGQHERIRKIRVDVEGANRLALLHLADVRDFQEQMREITARLGTSVVKIGRDYEGPTAPST